MNFLRIGLLIALEKDEVLVQTLYLRPSSGTMSTSKMYFAYGTNPDKLILQCGNVLL